MKDLREYIAHYDIVLDIESGPDWVHTDHVGEFWEHYAYTLRLTNGGLGTWMTLPWKQGVGITRDPEVVTVFDVMIRDAWGYENADGFEDWAMEYGYNVDSREAERIYGTVKELANDFLDFIGGKPELEKLALKFERL